MALSDDKRNGAILGHAIGDALGAPCEFYPFALYTGVLNTSIVRYSRAYGRQVCPVGQITDDTEMALVLMETLNSGYTKEKAVVNYMLWANNNYEGCKGNMPFMGKNTRNLFIAPKPSYKLYLNRFKKYYPDENTRENSQSNGALMRSYPLAFVEDWDIIHTDVEITNPSKLVQENNEFRDVTFCRGHVVHAFYCAFWGLFQFEDYKTAIDAICEPGNWKKSQVRVGDTDTNAAIAGALLGAFYGLSTLSSNPVTNSNIKILLECDSRNGDIIRPQKYSLSNLNINL
jgi:ADP-ribosylglycohydrolase